MARKILVLKDSAAIAAYAANEIVRAAKTAVAKRGRFHWALAGGSTPKVLYSLLVSDGELRAKIPWDKTEFFFGDERSVPPVDAQSNYKMAADTMLSELALRPDQTNRMKGEYSDTEEAAKEYEETLRARFNLQNGELPKFDLILAGMGDEGHTLSLFPGTKALHPGDRMVMSNWVGKLYTQRITLTAPLANNAAMIIFMVAGKEKALALKAVLEGPYEPEQLPAQLLQPSGGELLWLVDRAAGRLLSKEILDETGESYGNQHQQQ